MRESGGREDFERIVWRGCGVLAVVLAAVAVAGFAALVWLMCLAIFGW